MNWNTSFVCSIIILSVTSAATIVNLNKQCIHHRQIRSPELYTSLDGSTQYALDTLSPYHELPSNPHHPWSYPPTCTPTLTRINEVLCVYTSNDFASGRGISIFTTPALAQKVASLPIFFQRPFPQSHSNRNRQTHHTAQISGKGFGTLASHALDPDALLMRHTPAFIAYHESALSTLERERFWRVAIEQLPQELGNLFLDLAVIYGDERVRVQDVVKANTFQLDVGGVNHLAVWPEVARLNHECAPNAQYSIDSETLIHTVRATRSIAEGEEITIAYTSPIAPTVLRQQSLQSGFHFSCTCRRCASSTASDALLMKIHNLETKIRDWPAVNTSKSMAAADPEERMRLTMRLLDLYELEGLQGFMDEAFRFAEEAARETGDVVAARKLGEKRERVRRWKEGGGL